MIYENHFLLNQRPFTIAPNPDFLYDSGQYQDALAALQYGILHRGGFVLLTGEVGTGKTTLCKYLLNHVPKSTEIALILHPQLDRLEMLQLICREFGVDFNVTDKELNLIERLTEFLLAVYSKGGHSVLIIDEAQHLDTQVLELVRLLTNLETHQDKLLQIILLGQPELRLRLQQYNLRQLNQRFTARYHLESLSFTQMKSYIAHRLKVAGSEKKIFTPLGLLMLYKLSGGIPRIANLIADRSLMGGYATGKDSIGPFIVKKAATEVMPESKQRLFPAFKMLLTFTIVLFIALNLTFNGLAIEGLKEKLNEQGRFSWFGFAGLELDDCNIINECWQGKLPIKLLQLRQGLVKSNNPIRSLEVNVSGDWEVYTPALFTESSGASGLVNVRFVRDNFLASGSIKLGDYHGSILWVRNVLSNWSYSPDTGSSEDYSTWQVIKPNVVSPIVFSGDKSIYDQALEMSVKAFQQTYNLQVDGVIGNQTMAGLELLSDSMGGL